MAALAAEPVHVIATYPTEAPDGISAPANATVREFVQHGMVLDRAVVAITHGGMGSTQKALARGVPVCAVPYGRDQFEVARRVEVSRSGTRLPAKKLNPVRLKSKVLQAMSMTTGAQQVADGIQGNRRRRPRRRLNRATDYWVPRPDRSGREACQLIPVRFKGQLIGADQVRTHNPLVAGSSPARPT